MGRGTERRRGCCRQPDGSAEPGLRRGSGRRRFRGVRVYRAHTALRYAGVSGGGLGRGLATSVCPARALGPVARPRVRPEDPMRTTNRWGIALAGVAIQLALGAVYAWSVFR